MPKIFLNVSKLQKPRKVSDQWHRAAIAMENVWKRKWESEVFYYTFCFHSEIVYMFLLSTCDTLPSATQTSLNNGASDFDFSVTACFVFMWSDSISRSPHNSKPSDMYELVSSNEKKGNSPRLNRNKKEWNRIKTNRMETNLYNFDFSRVELITCYRWWPRDETESPTSRTHKSSGTNEIWK